MNDDRLREAWGATEGALPGDGEARPDPDTILAVARGEADDVTTRRVVEASARDPEVAALLRMAQAVDEGIGGERRADSAPRSGRARRSPAWTPWAGLAAAAAVLAIGLFAFVDGVAPDGDGRPVAEQRSGADAAPLAPLVEDRSALPRDAFELAWTPGPEGTVYSIEVATLDLDVVHRATGSTEATHVVPASALAEIEDGTMLIWRVEARLPDTSRIGSESHLVELAPARSDSAPR